MNLKAPPPVAFTRTSWAALPGTLCRPLAVMNSTAWSSLLVSNLTKWSLPAQRQTRLASAVGAPAGAAARPAAP